MVGKILNGFFWSYLPWFVVPVVVFLLVVLLFKILSKNNRVKVGNSKNLVYRKKELLKKRNGGGDVLYIKRKLLSDAEEKFYKALRASLNNVIYVVNPKMRIGDLVCLTENYDTWEFKRPIFMKHVDFVVCDKVSSSVLFAIELDDSSHNYSKEKDAFKDDVFKSAGIPLVRFKVQRDYDVSDVRKTLEVVLKKLCV